MTTHLTLLIIILVTSSTSQPIEAAENMTKPVTQRSNGNEDNGILSDQTTEATDDVTISVSMATTNNNRSAGILEPLSGAPAIYLQIGWILNRVRLCFLYPSGVATGLLTVVVLNRPSVRCSGVTPFLLCIAVADTIYNLLLTVVYWTPYDGNYYCKIMWHIVFASSHISDWVITCVAAIRAIAVAIPHKIKVIMTNKMTVVILVLIVILENCIELLSSLSADYPAGMECFNVPQNVLVSRIYGYFTAVDKVIMAVVIIVSTTVIIYKLRNRQESTASNQAEQGRQIAWMLVSICVLFIFTQLPGSIFFAISLHVSWPSHQTMPYLLYEIFAFLKGVNHMANVFLYCVSAKLFRQELWNIFRCKKTNTEDSISGRKEETELSTVQTA